MDIFFGALLALVFVAAAVLFNRADNAKMARISVGGAGLAVALTLILLALPALAAGV